MRSFRQRTLKIAGRNKKPQMRGIIDQGRPYAIGNHTQCSHWIREEHLAAANDNHFWSQLPRQHRDLVGIYFERLSRRWDRDNASPYQSRRATRVIYIVASTIHTMHEDCVSRLQQAEENRRIRHCGANWPPFHVACAEL